MLQYTSVDTESGLESCGCPRLRGACRYGSSLFSARQRASAVRSRAAIPRTNLRSWRPSRR